MPPHQLGQTQNSPPRRKKIANLRVRPFRQGRFDGLCALYAILNAFRLCLENHPLYDEIWPELFGFLVDGLGSGVDFAEIVLSGLPPKAMKIVVSNAARFLNEAYAIDLIVERPIDPAEKLTGRDVLKRLSALAERPHTALLIWVKLGDQIRHWTVVEKFNSRSLSLFDSAGFRALRLSEFRMSYESARRRDDRPSLLIKPRRIFLIRPA